MGANRYSIYSIFKSPKFNRKRVFGLAHPHVARMFYRAIAAMPSDKKTGHIQESFSSTQAMVKVTKPLADLIKQACRLQRRVA